MHAYIATQCGALLGSLAGVGVAIALDQTDKKDGTLDELQEQREASQRRAMTCISIGTIAGGVVGYLTLAD